MEFATTSKTGNQSVEQPGAHPKRQRVPSKPTRVSTNISLDDLPKDWQINKSLGQSMLTMYDAGLWTDITFRCKDQSTQNVDDRIRAHKIVLAARSPVFQAMFFGPCQEDKACIELKDIESYQFEKFIRTLYSDDFCLYEEYDDILEILKLAHKYQIEKAVTSCFHKLGVMVSITNACQLLDVALLYENESLRDRVTNFVDQNAEKVLKTYGFLELSLDGLYHVLKGNTFYANEVNIFNRAEEWAKRRCGSDDGPMIRKTLGKAFYYLRMPAMTAVEFNSCTKTNEYFSMKEYKDILDITVSDQRIKQQKNVQSNLNTPRIPCQFSVTCPSIGVTDVPSTNRLIKSIDMNLILEPYADIYLTDINMRQLDYLFSGNYKETKKHKITGLPVKVFISTKEQYQYRYLYHASSLYTINYGFVDAPAIHLKQPIFLAKGKVYNLKAELELGVVENLCFMQRHFLESNKFTGHENIICVSNNRSPKLIQGLTFKGTDQRHSTILADLK